MIDIVDLISSTFKRNKKGWEVKILAVLEDMFHDSCGKTSKALGAAFEPVAKSTVHGLAKKISEIKLAEERKQRLVIAVDETKLEVGAWRPTCGPPPTPTPRSYWPWMVYIRG